MVNSILMRISLLPFVLTMMLNLAYAPVAQATEQCPDHIAFVADEEVSSLLAKRLSGIYTSLGCHAKFAPYPGMRGLSMFNNHRVDGELIRIFDIKPAYTRPFVRSIVPLYSTNNSLWKHPDLDALKNKPIGYIHGIVWQVRYASKQNNTKKYYSQTEMLEAYQNGQLSGFLSVDEVIGDLTPKPVHAALVMSTKLYHYLGIEFTPFMKRLSAALEK